MEKAEPGRDVGACGDRELEAAVGVNGPIPAPSGDHRGLLWCSVRGRAAVGLSDAEAQGWLGTHLVPSRPLWGHWGPMPGPFPSCSGVSMLFPVGPSAGWGLRVGPSLDLLTLGKGCRSRNLGRKKLDLG